MKGIRRTIVTAQPGKLRTVDIREMLDSLDDDLQGCRDRALLLAGFAGGFRRSELAALDVGDVSKTEDGFVIRVRRSKTDPEGKGTSVALPYGSAGATCPVRSYLPRLDRQGSPHRGAGLPLRRPARAIHLTTSETRNMPEVVSQTFAPPSADDPLLAPIRQLGDTFYTFSPRAYPRNQACAVWVLTPSVLTAHGTRQRGSLPDRGATSSLDGMGPSASPERPRLPLQGFHILAHVTGLINQELLRREAGIPDNATHRERVHGVVPWDGHNPPAVGHDDVLALPRYVEAHLFERLNGPKVRDPGYLRHALGWDLHFP